MAERNRRTLDRELPSRAPRACRGPRRAPSGPAREDIHQLLPRGSLPLGTEQRHPECESHHAATITHGDSRRAAESWWTPPSLRDTPNARAITPRPSPTATVVALPRVGGLQLAIATSGTRLHKKLSLRRAALRCGPRRLLSRSLERAERVFDAAARTVEGALVARRCPFGPALPVPDQ